MPPPPGKNLLLNISSVDYQNFTTFTESTFTFGFQNSDMEQNWSVLALTHVGTHTCFILFRVSSLVQREHSIVKKIFKKGGGGCGDASMHQGRTRELSTQFSAVFCKAEVSWAQ